MHLANLAADLTGHYRLQIHVNSQCVDILIILLQALAAHIAIILPQRSVQNVAPLHAAQLDRDAVKRTLKGLVTDILGAEQSDLAPFMEVSSGCLSRRAGACTVTLIEEHVPCVHFCASILW